jgi:hypothetical protein
MPVESFGSLARVSLLQPVWVHLGSALLFLWKHFIRIVRMLNTQMINMAILTSVVMLALNIAPRAGFEFKFPRHEYLYARVA